MKFLEQFYVDMQKVLNDKYALIKTERELWEDEKAQIQQNCKFDSEVITINSGGKMIQTETAVLQSVPNSLLAKTFSGMHELKKVDNDVFLDRDGKTFETLVNYLRNDRRVFPDFIYKNDEINFFKELHFWGIDSHNRLDQEEYLSKIDKSIYIDKIKQQFIEQPLDVEKESKHNKTV